MTEQLHWIERVRAEIDDTLRAFFTEKHSESNAISPDSVELGDEVATMTMRGGKRLRPVVLTAAFHAAGGSDPASTRSAGASLELLQSYLLIHDDWMDQDDERRGGPAVHAAYRARHPGHLADALAILAGDLASAYAWELMLNAPFPAHRRAEALELFLQIQKEVFLGQHLDLTANPDVSRMHQLKTGSYTVEGPLKVGALLADATKEQMQALREFGAPLGEAFQLRDDLLGTFGDTKATGKPGNDLKNGKRTALILEVERLLPPERREVLTRVVGHTDASERDIMAAAELIISSGARKNVEDRLAALLAEAEAALGQAPFEDSGRTMLREVAQRLAIRKY